MMGITTALSIAGSAMSFVGQQQAADAQLAFETQRVEQQNQIMLQNAEAANKAFIDISAQENIRLGQIEHAASEELQDRERETAERIGTAAASSEGASLRVVDEMLRRDARSRNAIVTNLRFEQQQVEENIKGHRATAIDRINSVQPYTPRPVQGPSVAGLFMDVGKAAFNGYTGYKKMTDPKWRRYP